jgi:hypothetical protein
VTYAPGHRPSTLAMGLAMMSMDSLDTTFLYLRCGCAAFHSNSGECIDALRKQIAELQFKNAHLQGRMRRRRSAVLPMLGSRRIVG